MRAARLGLGVLGSAATAYGFLLVAGLGVGPAGSVLLWVAGGVLVHDAVLARLVVALGVLAVLSTARWWRSPLVWALVVLGPLTLAAVPVLGRFGARSDNRTPARPAVLGRVRRRGHRGPAHHRGRGASASARHARPGRRRWVGCAWLTPP